ncbi:flagellar hook-associated protein [Pseudothauera nasutitermitis]|uniref:Flagellar hook-associated protein 2 n=1 Tax=Pseudothauera nasutitermitis TaxID=2565930 RepID=A0A4S4B0X4_9RHOO|nr:flagellar filament capping protein FliD [Pseudothauera nasutitermitis]THF65702.1 flagellar hook-associated protein [Pseudothauera nasutitermitis]
MAAITTGGSVIDINTIVSGLMTVEQQPLARLATKEAAQQAKLSAFGQIKSSLASLQTATDALKKLDTFTATKTTVSSDAGFTATSKAGAASGSHTVEVLNLAREQRIATAADSTFTPAAGKLTVQFGTITDGAFVADGERMASLEFEGSTLEELRDAINGDASLGIKASIINNGTHNQLVLTGSATGENMAFRLTGEDGLADLSYDPAATPATGDKLYSVQAAESARLKVDGIEITRSKNTIDDVIDGVTLTLTKEPTGTATSVKGTLSITEDTSAAKSAIEAFVKAYNEAYSTIRSLTSYDAENEQASTLTGDSTARNIQNQLRNALNATYANDGLTSLSQLGISFDKTDRTTLVIDDTKLEAALKDPSKNVGNFFAGEAGFATSLSARLESFLDSKEGVIAGRTDGINTTIKALTKQYDALEAKLVTVEENYRLQYSKLDTLLASLTQTSTYLTQQLASLPKIGSSS